jgi:hypothetical protein
MDRSVLGEAGYAKAIGGNAGAGGDGLPPGGPGQPGKAYAIAGLGYPKAREHRQDGKNAPAGNPCPKQPKRIGVGTGHSNQSTIVVNRNWYTQGSKSLRGEAPWAIHVHPMPGQAMVMNGTLTGLWVATVEGPVVVFVKPLIGQHLNPNWPLTRSGRDGDGTVTVNLWRDSGRDILYASTWGVDVLAWSKASKSGNHPARVLTFAEVGTIAVAGDRVRDRLFVLARTRGASPSAVVLVVDNASTKVGAVTPDRTITGATDGDAIAYDSTRDILYLAKGKGLAIVKNASVANGAVTPILVSGAKTAIQEKIVSLAVFPDLDLLIAADIDHELIVFEKASTLVGNAACAQHASVGEMLSALVAWKEL